MENTKWVATWGCSETYTTQNVSNILEDTTFRYVIFSPLSGEKIRLRFTNRLGKRDAVIEKVCVAPHIGAGKIDASKSVKVTFGGSTKLVIPKGEYIYSDEIDFKVESGKEFAISLYIKEQNDLWCGHWNTHHFTKKYYGVGDYAEAEEIDVNAVNSGGPYVFLLQAEVLTTEDSEAIVAFGDSITAQPWPDWLAHRIVESGITNRSVIRRGIGGGRVLKEYKCRVKLHYGEAGIKRFERDISVPGVSKVFVLHGINDILHPNPNNIYCTMDDFPTTEEMLAGYQYYIDTAHKHGLKIYMSPILAMHRPVFDPERTERTRCEINEWIRNNKELDGIIDFEAATWDENNHKLLDPIADSGDHLHPSLEGARRMAYSIPEEFYKN